MSASVAASCSSVNDDRERSEFLKYCKFFTIRVVQVIVQSRTGRKMRTKSRVVGQPSDWFNLNVDESPEINQELKQTLGDCYLGPTNNTVCVLISLRTIDGETLHLEVWRLSLDDGTCDPKVSVRSQLYHRMSVLVRSAIAASRATPSYKLYARRQAADTFVLRYQLSSVPLQQAQLLGEGAKAIDLGFVTSPFGAVRMYVYYRTKMVISDTNYQDASLCGALRENFYEPGASPSRGGLPTSLTQRSASVPQTTVTGAGDLPLVPLQTPSPLKALPPLSDFSPCFSTFSTSPLSGEFPFSPSPVRRSSVAFQVGGATSCSSSEEGSSHGAVVSSALLAGRIRRSDSGGIPKRNSSTTLFKLELSSGIGIGIGVGGGGGVGGAGNTSPKPSSCPDHGKKRHSVGTMARRDAFPFAHLLASCSAPTFEEQYRPSSVGGQRRTVTAVAEEQPAHGDDADNDENLESSREVMVADGVKIVEKLKQRRRKEKRGAEQRRERSGEEVRKRSTATTTTAAAAAAAAAATAAAEEDDDDGGSSSDDSYVKYEMRPVFADGSDLGAFFSQCKSAPQQLKSFAGPRPETVALQKPLQEQIPQQLKCFEEQRRMFDDFVNALKVESSGDEDETTKSQTST